MNEGIIEFDIQTNGVWWQVWHKVEYQTWHVHTCMYGNINHLIVISSRMEISIRISTNYRPCLFSSFGNAKLFCYVSWIPIGHYFQRDHPLNLRPNFDRLHIMAFMGVWKSALPVNSGQIPGVKCLISRNVYCQCAKSFGVNYCLVYHLRSLIITNTNFYHLKN